MEKLTVRVHLGQVILCEPWPGKFWAALSFEESAELTNKLIGAQRKLLDEQQRQLVAEREGRRP
jgi:hypothetical protein